MRSATSWYLAILSLAFCLASCPGLARLDQVAVDQIVGHCNVTQICSIAQMDEQVGDGALGTWQVVRLAGCTADAVADDGVQQLLDAVVS